MQQHPETEVERCQGCGFPLNGEPCYCSPAALNLADWLEMLAGAEQDLKAAREDEEQTFEAYLKTVMRVNSEIEHVAFVMKQVNELRRGASVICACGADLRAIPFVELQKHDKCQAVAHA